MGHALEACWKEPHIPRYFIDTSDQDVFFQDDEGTEYPGLDAAKAAAIEALPDMARDALPDGGARTFLAIVRDENGGLLLEAALNFHAASLVPNSKR